ncbi:MAG TPA: hypothetical protein PKL15_01460 [Saprospiraceae bacterium]|nr:hypothetical protein [Saprospiraceae bacterium]
MNWFARFGWWYRPVAWPGWLLSSLLTVFLVWAFLDIDGRSHSASDTLMNWAFCVFFAALAYWLVAYWTRRRD